MGSRSDGTSGRGGGNAALSGRSGYGQGMPLIAAIALAAAVAGGNLAVTASPTHPRAFHRVVVRSTGQVGDSGGRYYLYRNRGVSCRASAQGERALGTRRAVLLHPPIAVSGDVGSFDFTISYRAGRAGTREWVCGYLYAITCDASGHNCGPATGLPPDAGWDSIAIRVRR